MEGVSRIRNIDTRLDCTITQTCKDSFSWPNVTTEWTQNQCYGTWSEIQDVPHPRFNYFKAIRGNIVVSPCYHVRTQLESDYVDIKFGPHPYNGELRIEGYVPAYLLATYPREEYPGEFQDPDLIQRLKDFVLVKAMAKLKTAEVQGLVSLGESLETIRMLRSPMSGARKFLKKMWRRKLRLERLGLDSIEASANTWLEFRYGWRCLCLEMKNIVQACHRPYLKPKQRRIYRARKSYTQKSEQTGAGTSFQRWTLYWKYTVTHSLEVTAGVIGVFTDATVTNSDSTAFGLGANELAVASWQLTRLSYVADWMVNVGDWLEAIKPRADIHVAATWVTVKQTSVHTMKVSRMLRQATRAPLMSTDVYDVGTSTFTYVCYTRQVNPVVPWHPTWTAIVPSVTRIADAAALISSFAMGLRGGANRARQMRDKWRRHDAMIRSM